MIGQSVVAYVTLEVLRPVAALLHPGADAAADRHAPSPSGAGDNYENNFIIGGVPGGFWLHLLNLQLTATAGVGIGLFISSVVNNSDKAMSIVPIRA